MIDECGRQGSCRERTWGGDFPCYVAPGLANSPVIQSQGQLVDRVSQHPDSPARKRGALRPEDQVTYVIGHRSRTEAAAQQLPHTREHLLPRLAERREHPLRCIMGPQCHSHPIRDLERIFVTKANSTAVLSVSHQMKSDSRDPQTTARATSGFSQLRTAPLLPSGPSLAIVHQ